MRGLISGHADFRRLWIGQTISEVGTQISDLAVPLIAVITLRASALQVSALFAAEFVPYVLIGLPAGVWVDRLRRQRIMIVTDLIRAVALLAVPFAMLVDVLSLPLLYGVVFVIGFANVFFQVAYQAYLPTVVSRDQLVEANTRLTASRSVSAAAGPTAGGWIVAALTAPFAVVADALSYLCSAAFLATIQAIEPAPARADRRSLRAEIGDGIRLVWGDRLLRAMTIYSAATSMAVMMIGSIEVVFLVRTVRLSTVGIGVLLGVTSLGAVLGAFVAAPVRRRLGEVPTLVATALVAGSFLFLVPLTALGIRLTLFAVGAGMASCGIVAYNVVSSAMMQRRCPDRLMGRMFATTRFIAWSTPPLGALLGGAIGTVLGLRTALFIGALLFIVAAAAFAWSLLVARLHALAMAHRVETVLVGRNHLVTRWLHGRRRTRGGGAG